MWQIWPGQLWPLTVSQEADFLATLEERVARTSRHSRDDVTALMSMLRCGTVLDEALVFAPGIKLPAMLSAYRRMETLRKASTDAWTRIAETPTPQIWRTDHQVAARLLPVAVERISAVLSGARPGEDFAGAVQQVQRRIEDTMATASELESRLAQIHPSMPAAGVLASTLFNPLGSCVYADPFYLPDRVSTISPARVGDLLGEERR